MKTKMFIFRAIVIVFGILITGMFSCSNDVQEEFNDLEQLDKQAIESDEVTEDDT